MAATAESARSSRSLTPAEKSGGDRWVQVGRVGKPHGLRGAFVVTEASTDPERFAEGATVYVGREPALVVEAKEAGGRMVVRLDHQVARGAALEVPASELPPAGDGAFYVFELVGMAVQEEDGRELGRVRDVLPGVANDVLDLEGGIALPLVEDCVLAVDVEQRRITVAAGFALES